ncbi:MAG: TlpA disulfide reductase family protein [Gammaproteobacteria bacterium]|jgi:thiol-disulfide isomerase/thioredoxin
MQQINSSILKYHIPANAVLTTLALLLSPFAVNGADFVRYGAENELNFQLPDLKDNTRSLADYRGKVVLVNFWASWCPPCIYEMPELTRLKAKLANRPFEILAINVGEKKYRVRKFTKVVNFDLPVLLDSDNEAFREWGVKTLPTSFLVDPDGQIRYRVRGNPGWEDETTLSLIETLINEPNKPAAPENLTLEDNQ